MSSALPRTVFRLRRGDAEDTVLTFLQSSYAAATLGDLRSLLDIAQLGISAADRLAQASPGATMESVGAPHIPSIRAGSVMVESTASIRAQGGGTSHKHVRAEVGTLTTVEEWETIIDEQLEISGYLGDDEGGAQPPTIQPLFLAMGSYP